MSELRSNLREEFRDKEYRHAYADESLNTYIATQIKVLREQRNLTQTQLADLAGMAQPRIAVLEDINYSSWSINTLRRLAEAFDLRLAVKFENFSSLVVELETLSRESLERESFDDDTWFHKKEVLSAESSLLKSIYGDVRSPACVTPLTLAITGEQLGMGANPGTYDAVTYPGQPRRRAKVLPMTNPTAAGSSIVGSPPAYPLGNGAAVAAGAR
jgi:transcriptional regulator with XRE-family HTH domain